MKYKEKFLKWIDHSLIKKEEKFLLTANCDELWTSFEIEYSDFHKKFRLSIFRDGHFIDESFNNFVFNLKKQAEQYIIDRHKNLSEIIIENEL